MNLLKIYITGLTILIVAIMINAIATWLNLTTWYTLIIRINQYGINGAISTTTIQSLIFMFILYPSLLGLTAYFCFKVSK